jgi:hypothetical protein
MLEMSAGGNTDVDLQTPGDFSVASDRQMAQKSASF